MPITEERKNCLKPITLKLYKTEITCKKWILSIIQSIIIQMIKCKELVLRSLQKKQLITKAHQVLSRSNCQNCEVHMAR